MPSVVVPGAGAFGRGRQSPRSGLRALVGETLRVPALPPKETLREDGSVTHQAAQPAQTQNLLAALDVQPPEPRGIRACCAWAAPCVLLS